MPTHPTASMERRYRAVGRALEAVRAEPAIATRLRRVGFGEERLAEGEAILAGVTQVVAETEAAAEAQRQATEALRRARVQLEGAIRDIGQLARASLPKNHPWLAQAGLESVRQEQSLDALLERAQRLFAAARDAEAEVAVVLQRIGLGPMALRMAEAYVTAIERARANQAAAREVSTEQMQVRATAFETLDDWMREFVTVARVALRDRVEWLTALGIAPRGRPRGEGV